MPAPSIEVIGVHRIQVTNDLVDEQRQILYPDSISGDERATAEAQVRDQLESVVLIEALIRGRDSRFTIDDFSQPQKHLDRSNWQAAWAEAYLDLDGEHLIVERWSEPPPAGDLRVAFYLHSWQPDLPLMTSYGAVSCPKPIPVPQRLQTLVPYVPVD